MTLTLHHRPLYRPRPLTPLPFLLPLPCMAETAERLNPPHLAPATRGPVGAIVAIPGRCVGVIGRRVGSCVDQEAVTTDTTYIHHTKIWLP